MNKRNIACLMACATLLCWLLAGCGEEPKQEVAQYKFRYITSKIEYIPGGEPTENYLIVPGIISFQRTPDGVLFETTNNIIFVDKNFNVYKFFEEVGE